MKIRKKHLIMALFFTIIMLTKNTSYAGSIGISTSTKNIEKGKTFSVTVSASNAIGQVNVKGTNCKVSESSVWLEDNSKTITVTAENEGTATVTVSTSDMADSTTAEEFSESKSVTVTVKGTEVAKPTSAPTKEASKPTPTNVQNTPTPKTEVKSTPTPTPTKAISSDATLKNLGLSPKEYDFTGFRRSKTDYSVEVDNSAEKVNIYAYANNSKAKVSGAGLKELKVGENNFKIKVTAEDKKTTKTYNLTIIRLEKIEPKEDEKIEENQNEKDDATGKQKENDNNLNITDSAETVDDSNTTNIISSESTQDTENNLKTDTVSNVSIDNSEELTIDVTKFNYEVQQAQAGLKKKNNFTKSVIAFIGISTIIFFVARHNILRKMSEQVEYGEESLEEIENPYSIYKEFDKIEEKPTKKRKKKVKGKRFK